MRLFYEFGRYLLFLKSLFVRPEKFKVYLKKTFGEMHSIGIGSLPIVAIISIFVGAVTTVQTAYQIVNPLIKPYIVGSIVTESTILELGPTITCLVLAGKVGSHIASELGTMRVSEQIDALEVMGVKTKAYLAGPKIIAALFMIPCLIIIADTLSIYGGYVAGEWSGILSHEEFIYGSRDAFRTKTLVFSMLKAVTFAFIITSISAYEGYYTKGGALEVGESSTRAVVRSCVAILFADYVLAQLFL